MSGQLFTHYFLTEGIKATPEWKAAVDRSETFVNFRNDLLHVFTGFSRFQYPNEAVTEQNLIRPILELLGWVDYLPQQGASHNEDIPDHLLFADRESVMRAAAKNKPDDRFRDALAVQESKRFGRALDTRDQDVQTKSGTPHGQILRYLSTAEIVSDNRIRWGILTNGGVWRLYDYRARPRASGYFEAVLPGLLEPGNEERLRLFQLLLRRDSFTLRKGATSSFLEHALAEGKRYEEQVAQDLSGVVFETAFPKLVEALADATGENLPRVRQSALIFLYRLLFVLYAEDRNLLPVNDLRYDDYGLRKRVRDDIARRMADGDVYSSVASNYYDRLVNLFRIIDRGDPSIGLPPYNGGLFASDAAPLLEQVRLPDATIAPIVYDLSHAQKKGDSDKRFVNYRDMSVQQLGSIYERLLEKEPGRGDDGKISIRPNPYARKDSGSFFTPQELVDLIVDRTLKPLAEERLEAFEEKAAQLKSDRRPKPHRKTELLKLDPAEAVLNLKVLDPAMGSGHFLVTAVDFLSDYIAELIEYVPAVPEWLDGGYVSPLVERVATVRREILRRAEEANWVLDEAQLTDQAIIRRMVLKRCIYGVDKNRRLGTNLPPFFPDIDSRFKFCALIFGGDTRRFDQTRCGFFLSGTEATKDHSRCFLLSPGDFVRVNPNTGTAPVFRTRRDAEITRRIYERHPVLVDRTSKREVKAWPVKYTTMFHMTNDSGLFRTREVLEEEEGAWPIGGNRFNSRVGEWLPLYEGKMVQAFDHRAASIVVNSDNQHRPAQPRPATLDQHRDPDWLPNPRFWVPISKCGWTSSSDWVLGFKEITAPTNVRTFIASLFPTVAFGNKVPILKPETAKRSEWLLAANLNATVFDFVTRQKVQGQTLNLFIVEQLPVVSARSYETVHFGPKTARQVVRDAVLELTYTTHDMVPFARDLGYVDETGQVRPPFSWEAQESSTPGCLCVDDIPVVSDARVV